MTALPRLASIANACWSALALPTVDEGEVHAPSPGDLLDRGDGVRLGSVDPVSGPELPGPSELGRRRTSTAMMGFAPQVTAPWMEFRPTPPAPMTATLLSGGTLARLTTAPKPVVTPQASSEATSIGMFVVDLDKLRLVDKNVLGESAHPRLLDDLVALPAWRECPSRRR